jgi:hypothetical protein
MTLSYNVSHFAQANVGQHIFKHCILDALAGKTRILVTHQVHLLAQCDLVVILDDGRIKAQGNISDLQQSGVDITAYVPSVSTNEKKDEQEGVDEKEPEEGTFVGSCVRPSFRVSLYLLLDSRVVLCFPRLYPNPAHAPSHHSPCRCCCCCCCCFVCLIVCLCVCLIV